MNKLIQKILPEYIITNLMKSKFLIDYKYGIKSYSQDGEDIVLRKIFGEKKNGFYIDVGAHHPVRFSNTYLFYQLGWQGINIDAMPGSMKIFNQLRPKDINIEAAISDKEEILSFYIFNEPALNSFSTDLSLERANGSSYKIISKKEVKTQLLSNVLNKYLPRNVGIDFLTIDVEGLDFQVLKSNDWNKYRPNVIIVEMLGLSIDETVKTNVSDFLYQNGYSLFAKTYQSAFFIQ